ncbi:MAG: phage minor head protein [Lachnospiraceae bacterium]
MQNVDSKKLNDLLVQIRRIEEHRTKGAEQAIRRMYKSLLDELRHFLADEFTRFAEDDKLTFTMLKKANEYARFLEEVEQKINYIEPDVRRQIRSTVEQTYQSSYGAMVEGMKETSAGEYLAGISSVTPDIVEAAVDNPISGLTLNDRLQKRRRDVIYDIKQAINVGLINGDGYTTMSKRVSKVVDGDYKKAVRIVRTEVHRVREAGNHDAAERVDTELRETDAGMVMAKTWKTMKDERVRPNHRYKTKSGWKNGKQGKYDHQSMEGVCIPIDEEFTLPSGAKTKAPGQSGVAGEDINCRCYLSYDLVEASKLKKRTDGFAERSLRTKSGGDYGVNWKVVKSKQYTERFSTLSDNDKANKLAAQRARNALINRNGKNTEELYAISLTTGKDVSSITNQHIPFGIKRTDKFNADVERAESNGEKILLIHNHPRGLPPSKEDINELLNHNNASGITVGHDGSIYYYAKPNKIVTEFDYHVAIRKTNVYNKSERAEKTIEELARLHGFEFKRL